jgi:hypothetical protein
MAKKEVMSIQDELRKELDGLKDRVDPPSGYMVGVKGKVFTLPNGSSDPGPLTCVILDWITANTWFEGIYNPKNIQPPACYALSAKPAEAAPSKNAPNPQSDSCIGCSKNEWGSDPQGGKGKACKNTRKLLIVPAGSPPGTQGWVISVSPTGLKHFDKYVASLGTADVHPIQVTTDIYFEESEAYPSLRFKLVEKHDEIDVMWGLKQDGQEILYLEPKAEKAA